MNSTVTSVVHHSRFRHETDDSGGNRVFEITYALEEETNMKMNTYVNFAGTCAEAFRFYEANLGGKIGMMMKHSQNPAPGGLGPDWKDAVLHARISLGGAELSGADVPNAQPMRSAYLTLGVESDAEAERIFSALSEGGKVLMPVQETFFATRFGQVQDRFGINWMIIHERPMPTGS